jgi:hypothetical protein
MLYRSDERFSGSECLAFKARLAVRRKFVRADNVARFSRPLGAFVGPMPRTSVSRSIFHREENSMLCREPITSKNFVCIGDLNMLMLKLRVKKIPRLNLLKA